MFAWLLDLPFPGSPVSLAAPSLYVRMHPPTPTPHPYLILGSEQELRSVCTRSLNDLIQSHGFTCQLHAYGSQLCLQPQLPHPASGLYSHLLLGSPSIWLANSWEFFFHLLIFEKGEETSACRSTYLCIHWLILVCTLTGDQTCNLGVSG